MAEQNPASEIDRLRRALARSELHLNAMLDSATFYAIVMADIDGTVTEWNAGAVHIFGWSKAEILGTPANVIFTPEDRAAGIPEREAAAARKNGRADDERWHIRKDGSRFWGTGLVMPLRDGDQIVGYLKMLRDRDNEERLSHALRLSDHVEESFDETLYRTMAHVMPQMAWMMDAAGDITWLNDRWRHYTGQPERGNLNNYWAAAIHPDYTNRATTGLLHAVANGKAWEDTFPIRGHDGSYRWFLSRTMATLDAQGNPVKWYGTSTDVHAVYALKQDGSEEV
ncbi:PAS domain-containing protein [Amantichitinum ursilacus]|uniref:Putative diguanylate cyclase n=1 Tax=Amantichitinum ursilacus TaxID=857265 RepID=A0A0N0XG13_9NEIS|nr:PAS domain S-box protein [Amantichitinum ursilacus]KPC49619.1 putative diguanylate cyclase [Amantichitinum ursilacus]